MNPPDKCLVTFRLSSIVSDLLRGSDYVVVSKETAELVLIACKNQHTCHVQLPSDENLDIFNKPITESRLWSFACWQASTERWLRQKKRSDDERDARNIFDANVRLVARAILRISPINPDAATCLARMSLLSYPSSIPAMGITKLITTVEEIP